MTVQRHCFGGAETRKDRNAASPKGGIFAGKIWNKSFDFPGSFCYITPIHAGLPAIPKTGIKTVRYKRMDKYRCLKNAALLYW